MEIEYVSELLNKIWKFQDDRISIQPLKGDASNRYYYRLFINNTSVIIMEFKPLSCDQNSFPFINILTHLKECNINVPEIYYSDINKGIILLEDFGDITLENIFYNDEEYIGYYYKAIDELLKIQIDATNRFNPECNAFKLSFDVNKFMEELNLFLKYLIEVYKGIEIRPEDRKEIEKYFLYISNILDRESKYFTHRDYHSRNIMIKDDEIKLVDFQDARMGLCQYDLASLLRDSYVTLDEESINKLIEYYIDRKEEIENIKIDREEFIRLFDFTSIQRNLKACGTFAFLYTVKNKRGYIGYIKNTLKYVSKNLDKYEELLPLKSLLKNYLEELL
jgi:hypothetical protein